MNAADPICAGCRAVLRTDLSLNTCETTGCAGNLIERGLVSATDPTPAERPCVICRRTESEHRDRNSHGFTPAVPDAGDVVPTVLYPHGPIVGHPKYDYYVCGTCHGPLGPGPCPAKVPTQPNPATFDSLLSDPTQQLDPEGVVIRSIPAEPDTGDVEALASALHRLEWQADLYATPRSDTTASYEARARRLLASDWYAVERRDTAEQIAQAIEDDAAQQRCCGGGIYTHDFTSGTQHAARIAREAGAR